MAKVLIGSRLPIGLILENPMKPEQTVEIQGLNKSAIIGANHMVTEVDGEFWAAWKVAHGKTHAPFLNGSIFEAKDTASARDKAKELKDQKTGLEQTPQRADGIKPANEDDK